MSFLNPLFLFGLVAAAIPVVIHLFTRRRPKELPFPSLEFLSEVNQSEIRRLKLKQWLLLLLRTLAIAAIALAMSRPALRGTLGPNGGAATTVVVLVDRSGSMGAAAPASIGGGTLMTAARRSVESVLATLAGQDECLLVPYDDAPEPVTPRPSSDLGRLRAAVQGMEPLAATTDHRRALEVAATAFRESHALNRELFWISDFQATRPADAGAALERVDGPWDRTRAYLVPTTPRTTSNVGLSDASLTPADGNVALTVTARAFAAQAGDLAVEALDAGRGQAIGRGFLNLPAQGDATALLPISAVPDQGGVAVIPDDVLPLDNRRYFASGRAGTLRIMVREDGGPSPLALALQAGSPASGLTVDVAGVGDLTRRLDQADALVLNDVESLGSAETQAVLDFYRAGGGVFMVLGERADPAFWNAGVLRELGAGELGAVDAADAGAAWRLMSVVSGHAVLAGFAVRPGEPLSSARFQRVRTFRPGAGARVVVEFDRAHPALVELPHAFVWASSLDPAASDFPVSGAFLPLVHQIARVLARGTAAGSLLPGDRYSAPATTGVWRIENGDGVEVASELKTDRGATRLVSAPLERPGLYRVTLGGTLRSTFAVNPSASESNLTPIPEATLLQAFPSGRAQFVRPGTDLARRVREARYGRELWSWFVVIALALLVAEMVLGRIGMASRAPERSTAGVA